MNEYAKQAQKPRCFLVYALAPRELPANRIFNGFIGDRSLPRVVFSDHFTGEAGGMAVVCLEKTAQRDAPLNQRHLQDWQVQVQPLIFFHSPSALDEQTAFILNSYRDEDRKKLREEKRPSQGNPAGEAGTAREE